MYPIFMKFDTQNKSNNMLIMNILTEIDDLDLKVQIWKIWFQVEMCSSLYEI